MGPGIPGQSKFFVEHNVRKRSLGYSKDKIE